MPETIIIDQCFMKLFGITKVARFMDHGV